MAEMFLRLIVLLEVPRVRIYLLRENVQAWTETVPGFLWSRSGL